MNIRQKYWKYIKNSNDYMYRINSSGSYYKESSEFAKVLTFTFGSLKFYQKIRLITSINYLIRCGFEIYVDSGYFSIHKGRIVYGTPFNFIVLDNEHTFDKIDIDFYLEKMHFIIIRKYNTKLWDKYFTSHYINMKINNKYIDEDDVYDYLHQYPKLFNSKNQYKKMMLYIKNVKRINRNFFKRKKSIKSINSNKTSKPQVKSKPSLFKILFSSLFKKIETKNDK